MKFVEKTRVAYSLFVVFILVVSLTGTVGPVLASCGGVTNVSNETELNDAIADFNGQTGPCQFTITLTSNIALTASTTTINNPAGNVELLIDGDAYFVDGQDISDVRPFTIATDTTVTMQNITVWRGNVDINGGAIHNSGNLTLSDADIFFNIAGQEGGGLWNSSVGTMTIQDGTIVRSNTANIANAASDAQGGGGIFNNGGTVDVSNSIISNNVVDGPAGVDDGGGGIFNDGRNVPGTVTVISSSISGNTALTGTGNGGGLLNIGDADTTPTLNVSGGSIDSNEAWRVGGGVETNQGLVTLNSVSLTNNTTGINGGGLHATSTDVVTITGGTISGNTAEQEGGGLWNGALGTMTVQNGTIIEGNTANIANAAGDAQGGGGVFNNGGTVEIMNATISNNVVDGPAGVDDGGGGVFNDGRNTPGTITLTSTTIMSNTALSGLGNGGGLLNIGDADTTPTLNVSGGSIDSNEAWRVGGGVETNQGLVTLNSVSLTNNTTGINGGGLHATSTDVVTITGGTISGNTAEQEGGGLWNGALGTMTVQNGTIIEGNTANIANAAGDAQGGGGLFNNGGTVDVSEATIRNNVVGGTAGVDDGGGGILNDGRNTVGTVTLTDTTISGNTALSGQGNGGGVLNVGAVDKTPTVSINGGEISGNEAARVGGGIETILGTVSLNNVSMSNNDTGLNGGGLHVTSGGTATINTSTISNNDAGNEGAGLWLANSATAVMTVTASSLVGNEAPAGGGGIFNDGAAGRLHVENSTLSGNGVSASDGGGLDTEGGEVTLLGVTVAGNSAAGNGGGINADPGTTLDVTATLIGDNTAGGSGPDMNGTFAAVTTSLLENGSGAGGITDGIDGNIVGVDGGLLALGNYGGPTPVHALSDDSSALDAAGDSGLNTDQRGVSRPQGAADDIGAFELIRDLYLPLVITN